MQFLETLYHQLFDKHVWTDWYFWGDGWKRRHCKVCFYAHNNIVPYELKRGCTSKQGVNNNYRDIQGRIPFDIKKEYK